MSKSSNSKKLKSACELCAYYVYDEDYDCYMCQVCVDEDEMSRYLQYGNQSTCNYFHLGDEYKIARKQ